MAKWGGQLRPQPDGSYHATLWRADERGGKGERLSWEQERDGRVRSLHHTDQDHRSHSSDPGTWRGTKLLFWLFTLAAIAAALCQLLA